MSVHDGTNLPVSHWGFTVASHISAICIASGNHDQKLGKYNQMAVLIFSVSFKVEGACAGSLPRRHLAQTFFGCR